MTFVFVEERKDCNKITRKLFGQYLEKNSKVSHTLQQETNKKNTFKYKINFPNKFCLEN